MRVLYLYSYNENSKAAKLLARHLLVRRIRHTDSRFRGAPHLTVINWGSSEIPRQAARCHVLNPPNAVEEVVDKASFFKKLRGKELTPAFTTSAGEAAEWIKDGARVLCRTFLRSSGGTGIVVAQKMEEVVPAPLYVRYVPKKEEYRVHIFGRRVVDIQKKMKRHDIDTPDWTVQNLAGGFIYGREGISPPVCVPAVALSVFEEFSLDFGAVDIIYNKKRNKALALEINTAPGLEGQTVVSYADALKEYLRWVAPVKVSASTR
jgi:glutathione synthase/RimK-type ligase-like ATP-grasp enzyme